MPQQFYQAEEPVSLKIGVTEPRAVPTVASETNAPRYTPDDVRHILAEAARLQTFHQETLSQGEIEAIGLEVGIEPKFVRQAIEQVSAPQTVTQRRRKRLPRLEPLPFHAVAKTALLPILYASLLIPITSWRPESGFANWFLFLYMVLPPLIAFSTGYLQKSIRLSAAAGAFWGLGILFALALPNAIKLYQNPGNTGSEEMLQLLSETGMLLGLFLLYGAAFGIAGALTRRGAEKSRNWFRKHHSDKTRAKIAMLRGS